MEGEKNYSSLVKKKSTVGLKGGNGGANWDDGKYNGVREITVVYDDNCIHSIGVVYDKNGKPFAAERHGGIGGDKRTKFELQFPEEFLTGVNGHIGHWNDNIVIRSLAFKSNRRTSRPVGMEEGEPFTLSIGDGEQIVGFTGKSSLFVETIGVRLSRAETTRGLCPSVQKFKKLFSSKSSFSSRSYSKDRSESFSQ